MTIDLYSYVWQSDYCLCLVSDKAFVHEEGVEEDIA